MDRSPTIGSSPPALGLLAAGWSHPGRVRARNEDRFHCDGERGVFIVVDGVGGQAAGEVAATTALDVVLGRLLRRTGTPEERLREAVALANNEVHRLAQEQPAHRGMACVLTAAIVEGGDVVAAHVGDTRLYKLRRGEIQKLTHDHSVVGVQEDAGELDEMEAMRHPRRNEIYRDVGSAPHAPDDPDFIEILRAPFEADAALLLCSDGLTDLVPSRQLFYVVSRTAGAPQRAVEELIHLANEAGGKDNITVIVVNGPTYGQSLTPSARGDGSGQAAGPQAEEHPGARFGPSNGPAAGGASWLLGRGAVFVYGVLCGLLLLTLARDFLTERLRPSGGRTLAVAADGSARYAAPAAALAAARAGDVVRVAPGVYTGAVRVPAGVWLQSAAPREAVIRPDSAFAGPVVVVEGGGRFTGFRVAGGAGAGLLLRGRGAVVEDVEVTEHAGPGVVLDSLGVAVVRQAYIHRNAGDGVRAGGGASLRMEEALVLRNGRGGVGVGLRLAPSASTTLARNVFGGNAGGDVAGVDAPRRSDLARHNLFGVDLED